MDNDPRIDNLKLLVNHFHNQRELERMTGVTQASISNAINGKRKIGIIVCRRIEEALGLPAKWMDYPQTEVPLPAYTLPAATTAAKSIRINPNALLVLDEAHRSSHTTVAGMVLKRKYPQDIEIQKEVVEKLLEQTGLSVVESSVFRAGPFVFRPDLIIDLGEDKGLLALDVNIIVIPGQGSPNVSVDKILANGLRYKHSKTRYLPVILLIEGPTKIPDGYIEKLQSMLDFGITVGVLCGYAVASDIDSLVQKTTDQIGQS